MVKSLIVLGVIIGLVVVGVVAYSFLKEPEEASGPIEAVPVADAPTDSSDAESSEPEPASGGDATVFEIIQAGSEARFIIDEVLNGAPKTVVGTTDQVAGEIAVDPESPSSTKIGTILVNARTLSTDNDFRNRAIKNRILSTNDYEFVSFEPTGITGLPGSISIGESFDFQITGDLTVRDVTKEVTFDATVTPLSETQLEGAASTTILYPDFNLTIPNAPSVASVEDEVILEIDFVAAAQ